MNIKSIKFLGENRPSTRKIKIALLGGSIITIEPLYESWRQYGGTESELWETMIIAEKYNVWLHGGER